MWVNYFQKISLLYGTIKSRFWDFPGGPMGVKSLHFHCRAAGESLTPGWKTKILHAPRQKKQKTKKNQNKLGCTDVIYLMSQAVPWTTAVMGVHTRPSCGQQTPPSGRPPRRVSLRPWWAALGWHTGGALALSCLPSSLPHRHHGDQAQQGVPDGDPEQR